MPPNLAPKGNQNISESNYLYCFYFSLQPSRTKLSHTQVFLARCKSNRCTRVKHIVKSLQKTPEKLKNLNKIGKEKKKNKNLMLLGKVPFEEKR